MKKFKRNFTVSIFCFFCITAVSQSKETVIKIHKEFNQLLFTNFEKANEKATLSVLLSQKTGDKSLLITSYNYLSEILYLKKENDSAQLYNEKAILLALELSDNEQLAELYNLKGSIEKRKNNYTASIKYYEKALALANNNSKEEIPKIKNNIARLYWATGEKQKSIKKIEEVINTTKTISKTDLADAYNILGVTYLEKNKDSSLIFYKKAFSLSKKSNNDYLKSVITSNLGYLQLHLNKYIKKHSFT